jgi:hypothetical protein
MFYVRRDTGRVRPVCRECWSVKTSAWRKKNSEKTRLYVRRSCKKAYDADPEKYRAKSRAKRLANPEQAKKIVNKSYKKTYKARYQQERARLNASSAARRAATPKWLSAIQKAQIQEFYDVARCLETQTGIKHHVDHVHPINGKFLSGLHVPWNLQILTASENCSKKNRV